MKRFFTAILTACLALPVLAQDKEDKIGTANMARLFVEYYKTKEILKTFEGYRDEVIVQRDERLKVLTDAAKEAQKFEREAESDAISDENRSELLAKAAQKGKEAQGLRRDLNSWLGRRQSAMDEKKAMEFAALRKEILAIVRSVGDEEGFDYIFDRSGASIAGINVLIYTKDATDLTGLLLERINKDEGADDQ